MENCENQSVEEVVGTFAEENRQAGLRVFVAGGSRSGNDSVYVEEAYNLGKPDSQNGVQTRLWPLQLRNYGGGCTRRFGRLEQKEM